MRGRAGARPDAGPHRRGHSRWSLVPVLLIVVVVLAACDDINSVKRPDAPVVLTGADLTDLVGSAPGDIVAFAHSRPGDVPTWTQVPVQVDQRKVVDFGNQPPNNTTAGVTGTVYGHTTTGVTAIQYADPNTWVGADADPTFDANDELVFMAGDGGGRPRTADVLTEPPGVVHGSGVRVQFDDPRGDDEQGWIFLYLADHGAQPVLGPAAGEDYVDYNFVLTSGNYKTTYKRQDGPNPETSNVVTDNYSISYTDRWYETDWKIADGTNVDILDGNRNQFGLGNCGRSNFTFSDAEGAFVANIDGPVRGIRSYVGANSGPLTQRTHTMYRDREEIKTDLRVHIIAGIMDYIDYNTSAIGMTYYNSAHPGGVTMNGVADAVSTALPSWELVTGSQGSVMTANVLDTSLLDPGESPDVIADGFYRDELNSIYDQCWGDPHLIGASGNNMPGVIPNTDPKVVPFETLSTTRIERFEAPGITPTDAADWAADVAEPLTVTVTPYDVP